jgi:hypothetical protein
MQITIQGLISCDVNSLISYRLMRSSSRGVYILEENFTINMHKNKDIKIGVIYLCKILERVKEKR